MTNAPQPTKKTPTRTRRPRQTVQRQAAANAPAHFVPSGDLGTGNDFQTQQPARRIIERPDPVNIILQNARLEKRLDLNACADHLCIRRVMLDALEKGNYHELPSTAHTLGFIRSYADFLGLNAQDIVDQFKRDVRDAASPPELHMPVPLNDNRMPSMRIIFMSLAAAVGFYALWNVISTPSTPPALNPPIETAAEETLPAPTTAESIATPDTSQTSVTAPSLPAPITAPVAAPVAPVRQMIDITARQDSWMQIRNGRNELLFSRILKTGETYSVPTDPTLTLTTGNAGGIDILVDGKALGTLGAIGQVIKNYSLVQSPTPVAQPAMAAPTVDSMAAPLAPETAPTTTPNSRVTTGNEILPPE